MNLNAGDYINFNNWKSTVVTELLFKINLGKQVVLIVESELITERNFFFKHTHTQVVERTLKKFKTACKYT